MKVIILATNNLPNRNGARFPVAELPLIAEKIVGCAASVDHEYEYEEQWGTVISAEVQTVSPTPYQLKRYSDIIKAEGVQNVIVVVQSKTQTEIVPDVGDHASISALFQYLTCPGCDCDRRDVFGCPKAREAFDEKGYIERLGVEDVLEISLVLVPAVPDARVIEIEP